MSIMGKSDDTKILPNKTVIPKANRIQKFTVYDAILIFLLALFGLSILYPFYNAVLVSIVPQQVYVRAKFMLWPTQVIWDSYVFVFKSRLIWSSMMNSIIVTTVGTAYNMVLTILCAYALTKPIPGRRFFRFLIVFTMYFSGGIIPFYLLIKDLKLMNSLAVMIIPTGIAIMYMLIISNYFNSLPPSMEESAKIDGYNDIQILFKIVIPISTPAFAAIALFYAVALWNEYFYATLFISTSKLYPLPVVLRQMIIQNQSLAEVGVQSAGSSYEQFKMACIIISLIPVVVAYPFVQKYFTKGISLGAVKE